MKKRVFIVHGWAGDPDHAWFLWLKKELEKKEFFVSAPQMPEADAPEINKWVPKLAKTVGKADQDTYLVGHSIGCQTVLRYLESLPKNEKVGGVVLVAGFVKLTGLTPEELPIAKPWLETPIDWNKVKNSANIFVTIHSDNDRYVPLENADLFKEKLKARVIIEHNKGHYSESNTNEIPVVLKELLGMLKK